MKPFLTWEGNRNSIATAIRMRFPVKYGDYYEPMLGGGGVFLATQQLHRRIVLGDSNSWLVDCYRAVRDSCHQVIDILDSLAPCELVYHRIREIHPETISIVHRAAHLIYLNKLAFGHVFRVNRAGYFNVPYGGVARPVFDRDELCEFSQRLYNAEIWSGDYRRTVFYPRPGDFIYFDPPSTESRSFGYSGSERKIEFDEVEYQALYSLCVHFHQRGVFWAISDENTSMARLLFHGYPLTSILKDPRDDEIKHLLITNYQPLTGEMIPSDLQRQDEVHAAKPACCTSCAAITSGSRGLAAESGHHG